MSSIAVDRTALTVRCHQQCKHCVVTTVMCKAVCTSAFTALVHRFPVGHVSLDCGMSERILHQRGEERPFSGRHV